MQENDLTDKNLGGGIDLITNLLRNKIDKTYKDHYLVLI